MQSNTDKIMVLLECSRAFNKVHQGKCFTNDLQIIISIIKNHYYQESEMNDSGYYYL